MKTGIARVLRNKRWQVQLTLERAQEGIYIGPEFIRGDEPIRGPITAIYVPLTRLALRTTLPYEQTSVRPEGNRTEGSIEVYTQVPLQVKRDQQPGDRFIDFHGEDWEVMSCERWDEYGFYVVIASMLPRGLST